MTTEDDDDEGFGYFTSAPRASSAVVVNSRLKSNGSDPSPNDDNDDDWGDFVKSSVNNLPRTESPLPAKSLDPFNFISDQHNQNSKINNSVTRTQWEKPNGALPLSLFGEEEKDEENKEEGSGAAGLLFNASTQLKTSKELKKDNQVKSDFEVSDLISILYQHDNGSNLDLKVSGFNLGYLSSNGLNLDPNGSDRGLDEGDGWEFKVAETKQPAGDFNIKSDLRVKAENVPASNVDGFDSRWSMLGLDLSRSSSNLNGNLDANKSSLLVDESEDFEDDDDGWEFKVAESETQTGDSSSKVNSKGPNNSEGVKQPIGFGNVDDFPTDLFAASNGTSQKSCELDFGFDFSKSSVTPNGISSNSFSDSKLKDDFPTDLFVASVGTSQKSGELDFGLDFSKSSAIPDGISSNSFSDSKQDDDDKNGLSSALVNGNVDNGDNSWELKDAFSVIQSKDKGNKVKMENHKGALPLSLFGDEEHENDDPSIYQDALTHIAASSTRGSTKNSPVSNLPINDLLSSLYSQAEQNSSVNHTQSPSGNHFYSPEKVVESNIIVGEGDFDDDSWEFKDASSGTVDEKQTLTPAHGDSHMPKQEEYADFYSKLEDELCVVAQCHLDNLEKARSTASLGGEDAKVKTLDKEIQDFYYVLHRESVVSREPHSENHPPSNICLAEFVEVLQDPKFHALESEYHLSNRLSLAEKDWRSAIELLKHVASISKILTLGSKEEQSNYVSTWFRMVSVCAQELKQGASIWKQSLQKNVHGQILLDPRGKQYILALGEIYRAVEVLGSSVKLYKPWILSSYVDPTGLFTLLRECSNLWSSSGLEEAFQNISDLTGFKYNGTPKELLESVKYIHDLDALALHDHVFSGHGPTCRLSLLTAGTVPGMETVIWKGENYFLKLANLWANLVSSDPPNLPHMHIG